MERKRLILVIGCIFILLSTVNVWAKETPDETGIVTEANYEPIDKQQIEGMKDTAMGNQDQRISRSAGPYWTANSGLKRFYDGNGTLMYGTGSKYVIDVSEHNGTIDWNKVKASGVDGAIIRVGYGYLEEDDYFRRNVSECNRLGIPYGIYLYSYAYDANFAYAEASGTAEMLSRANVNLSYPIYYDIENFSPWDYQGSTRKPPQSASAYKQVIKTYLNRMNALGYKQVHVYSYRSYLQTKLNDPEILSHVSWIAAYTDTLGYKNAYYNGEQGWQYTSDGYVDGISGRVDLNCFSNQFTRPTAKDLTFNQEKVRITLGEEVVVNATKSPYNAVNSVSYHTGNKSIATVNQKGKITATGLGGTYLYAKTSNGLQAKVLIHVVPRAKEVSINYDRKEINLGDKESFKATVYPKEADQDVVWRTGNSKIATVDQNGNVKGVGKGGTWLYAKTPNGKEAKCLVKVVIPAEKMEFKQDKYKITIGKSELIKANLTPSNATISYKIGNENIATVDNEGNVYAKGYGGTYLYANTSNGIRTKTLIHVVPKATTISLGVNDKEINVGESYTFKVDVFPKEATPKINWRIGNSSIATVDQNGKVVGISKGGTWLYAKTDNGLETKCLIKIRKPATSISLPLEKQMVTIGNKITIKANVRPIDTTTSYTYRTGNKSIAVVDKNGQITAVGLGGTYLYVKTANGLEAKTLIHVVPKAESITLNMSRKEIKVGKSYNFKAITSPSSALQNVSWRIGNSNIAVVDQNGKVTGISKGGTWLYAKNNDGLETKCLVKIVEVPAISVNYNEKKQKIRIGNGMYVKPLLTPDDATVTYRIGNKSIATVDEKGFVKGISEGGTYLYCKSVNGKESRILIHVIP